MMINVRHSPFLPPEDLANRSTGHFQVVFEYFVNGDEGLERF
jgi:hypothetical protein